MARKIYMFYLTVQNAPAARAQHAKEGRGSSFGVCLKNAVDGMKRDGKLKNIRVERGTVSFQYMGTEPEGDGPRTRRKKGGQ
jgi:hypothetical protein